MPETSTNRFDEEAAAWDASGAALQRLRVMHESLQRQLT